MTFQEVDAIHNRLYDELREANKENAPSSYTWVFARLDDFPADSIDKEALERAGPEEVGNGKPVAFVYECAYGSLAKINEEAGGKAVEALLRLYMGLGGETRE